MMKRKSEAKSKRTAEMGKMKKALPGGSDKVAKPGVQHGVSETRGVPAGPMKGSPELKKESDIKSTPHKPSKGKITSLESLRAVGKKKFGLKMI